MPGTVTVGAMPFVPPAALPAFGTGFVLGGLVAAQLGPVALLCIRTVLRSGVRDGLALGAGVAVVDLGYACLGVAGAAQLLRFTPLRLILAFAGAAVLALLGARTLRTALFSAWRIRLGAETATETGSPFRALRTGIIETASNPLTVLSWGAAFGAASTGARWETWPATVGLIAGVGAGSLGWHIVLVGAVGLLRRRVGDRSLRLVDALSGAGLLAFAGVLGLRAVRNPP